jgi:hypothetical protein
MDMGRFAGLGGIRTNTGGVFFVDGDFLVDLTEVKFIKNRKNIDCFIVAGAIVSSTSPDRIPGTVCSQVIALSPDYYETAMGNIKQFASAVLGIESPDTYVADVDPTIVGDTPAEATDRFWDEALEALIADEQPAKGLRLRLNCVTIITKTNKKPFLKHFWSPAYEEVKTEE